MGILGVIVHFNELDTGLAGNLDWQILARCLKSDLRVHFAARTCELVCWVQHVMLYLMV